MYKDHKILFRIQKSNGTVDTTCAEDGIARPKNMCMRPI